MDETFEDRDLAGAIFRRVNLSGADFEDVNLEKVTIRNANLKDLAIDDAFIAGLTIFGIRVDRLISGELDRRDPERVRLRMSDPHDPQRVRELMDRLDELRGAFYASLRSADPRLLITRPGPEQWSVLEIVRHLLFAEDLYLNRWILRNDAPWEPMGLLPSFLAHEPQYAGVGREPSEDLEAVLERWAAIHAGTRAFVAQVRPEQLRRDTSDVDFGQGTVGVVLQGMAQHDLAHIREAQPLLGTAGKQAG